MEITIASLGKTVVLGEYTRAIARTFNETLLSGVNISTDSTGAQQVSTMPAVNADRAEEIVVRLMSGLSQEEIDKITEDEYTKLKNAVNEKTQKKSVTMKF